MWKRVLKEHSWTPFSGITSKVSLAYAVATSVPKWLVISTKKNTIKILSRSRSRRKPNRKKSIALTVKCQKKQEISNGRTHGPRTPKKPEYLLALASYWTGSVGIRSHSIFDGKNRKKNRAGLGLGSFFSTGDPCDLFTRPCRNSSPFGFARREKNNLGRRSRFFFGAFYGHHVWWICHPFSPPNNKPIFAAFLRVTKKEQLHKPRKLGDGSRRNRLFFQGQRNVWTWTLKHSHFGGRGISGISTRFCSCFF